MEPLPTLRVRGARGVDLVPLLITGGALVVLALLAIRLVDLLLMVFGSILVAILVHLIAEPLQKWVRMERRLSLAAALLIVGIGVGLLIWLFGSQISAQVTALSVLLPKSWAALQTRLSGSAFGEALLAQIRNATWPDNFLLTWATRIAGSVASGAAAIVIVVVGGAYLAFHPQTYVGGLVVLAPGRHRDRIREALEACRLALRQWLLGQLVSMVFIAATTAVGLWLAGVPSPLALGLVAGVGQLLPVVGPWLAAAPGLIIALAQGPQTLGWAFAVYAVTTQVEANFVTPLVLRQMASVPMAVTLFAMIAMGTLMGPVGALLSAPLATVAYVLVRKLYLEGALGERL